MDVRKKQWKKIFKYIVGDRYKKLSKYLTEEAIPLDAILNRRGEKLLHVAAKEGAASCLEDLLERGAKAHLVDRRGNLPLHHAIRYCLEHYASNMEHHLVSTLLSYYSTPLLNLENTEGVSCRDLLAQLEERKQPDNAARTSLHYQEDTADSDDEAYSDRKWREKLAAEADIEFAEHVGKFHEDDDISYGQGESYDDWADRIYRAFTARRRQLYMKPSTSKSTTEEGTEESKKPKLRPEINLEEAGKRMDQLRERSRRKKISQQYQKIFDSKDAVGADDIPYKDLPPSAIIHTMLQDVPGDEHLIKKRIRDEIRRWHPDKFSQKLADRIKPGEKERVLERVKIIAQALTSYGK